MEMERRAEQFNSQMDLRKYAFIPDEEAINTTTPSGRFVLTVFAAMAELEREYILQRQKEGIAIAKEQGKYTGRKRIQLDDFDEVFKKWERKEITAVDAINKLGISKSTFYRRVSEICVEKL